MSTVICTLGMHRSGTSVVSRMLNLAGVSLGSDLSLADAGCDNPTGYWEHAGFKRINESLLHRFGGRWDRPPVFPPAWTSDSVVLALAEEARQILSAEFATAASWSWKDPRTCLTLPFWRDVVGPMRYIICLRDPRDVAASLQSRNRIDAAEAEALWLAYLESALRHTDGHPRLFVHYDAVLADSAGELGRVAQFAGVALAPGDAVRIGRALGSFIDPSLRHQRASAGSPPTDTPPMFWARSLYLALLHAVPGAEPLPSAQLASVATGARSAAALHAAATADASALREQASALARDNAALRNQVAGLEARCDGYESENQAVRRAILDIHGSSAWRLVTAWRRATATLLPPGSRRQARAARVAGWLGRRSAPTALPAPRTPNRSR